MSIYNDGIKAKDALNEYTSKYTHMIESVRWLCVQTLAMGETARREYAEESGFPCHTTQDLELKGQESMAYMILDELGLEVDYWFSGTPILKDKEDE